LENTTVYSIFCK